MSPPPVPDLASAIAGVFRLSWRRLMRGRKLRLGLAATILVAGAGIAARYAVSDADPVTVVQAGIRYGFFGMLVYLLPFLFNSGAIAEEVEARTFTYLAVRPAGRAAIALGKYAAGAAASVLLLAGGILALHVAAFAAQPGPMVEELPDTLRAIGAISLLALCYAGICLFWGSWIVEAGGVLSTIHLAAFEFGLSFLPSFMRLGSMNYLASQLAGLPKGGFFPDWVPDVEPGICAAVVAAAALAYVGLAALIVRVSELGFGRA
jgi:ABC-type transport system involved in multi-copper enzyme maturation permease subunit